MRQLGYTVEMIGNPDEPMIGYWVFDSEEAGRAFFESLKRGCTAHHITVEFSASFSNGSQPIESFVMGDENNQPTILHLDKTL